MAVISPPILKLLSDLDIDLMDVDSDMDYLRALMEATNSLTISNPSDRRIPILQKEVKEFLESMNSTQFKSIETFFETMPKLSHTIKVTNPKTKVESDVVLEGLASFFA